MIRYLCIITFVFFFSSQAHAFSKQCTDVDANSVKQVQTCIASSSQMSYGLDAAGQDFAGCSRMKQSFSVLTGIRMDADSDMMPTCNVFAPVLQNLNGKKPVWANCIDFAEKQTNLSACYSALKKAQKITNTFEAKTCPQVKRLLQQVVMGMSGNYNIDLKKLPGCEKIAVAMRENNHEMSGYACGKYKPDSQQHINACLHSYFAAYKYYGLQLTQTCDPLRQFYHAGVQSMHDGEKTVTSYGAIAEPPGFQVAQCGMLEAAVSSYNEDQYAYEQFETTDKTEEPVRKTNTQEPKKKERANSHEQEEVYAEDPKELLKQTARTRVGESGAVNKATQYQQKYEEVVEETEAEPEEEKEEPESLEKETKKKLKKKLFDKLGL
jgi:hypothetical protein